MVVTPFVAAGVAPAVLALSKTAWKLGSSLSKLDQDTKIAGTVVKSLTREIKALGNECDLVYAELEEVIGKGEVGLPPPYNVGGRIWSCLATQVEEASRTMQDLELYVADVRGMTSSSIGQAQRKTLEDSKDQVASFRTKVSWKTDNLRTTLLMIKM